MSSSPEVDVPGNIVVKYVEQPELQQLLLLSNSKKTPKLKKLETLQMMHKFNTTVHCQPQHHLHFLRKPLIQHPSLHVQPRKTLLLYLDDTGTDISVSAYLYRLSAR